MLKTPAKYLEAKKAAYHADPEGHRAKSKANHYKHRGKRVSALRVRYQANKLEICKQLKAARKARHESGLCGCGAASEDGKLSCRACREKARKFHSKNRARGLCGCGNPSEKAGKVRCLVCRSRGEKYAKLQRAEMIDAYGGKCRCCGEGEPTFLALDHIFNDGALDRRDTKGGNAFIAKLRKQGFPKDRFQLLCHNCNFAKRLGPCPHVLGVK